jgi:hypothetical protein
MVGVVQVSDEPRLGGEGIGVETGGGDVRDNPPTVWRLGDIRWGILLESVC